MDLPGFLSGAIRLVAPATSTISSFRFSHGHMFILKDSACDETGAGLMLPKASACFLFVAGLVCCLPSWFLFSDGVNQMLVFYSKPYFHIGTIFVRGRACKYL